MDLSTQNYKKTKREMAHYIALMGKTPEQHMDTLISSLASDKNSPFRGKNPLDGFRIEEKRVPLSLLQSDRALKSFMIEDKRNTRRRIKLFTSDHLGNFLAEGQNRAYAFERALRFGGNCG